MTENRPALAVFASGNGSNLQALIDGSKTAGWPAEIRVVVSDKKDAFALERAKNANIEAVWFSPKQYASREAYDLGLVELLRQRSIDWVILAGFMRILSPVFVRPYLGKMINVHPALLPKYPGTHSIERAFQAGEKEVGVTVHFVDEGVDTGPIIVQEAIPVQPGETLEQLTGRVHDVEHRIFPEAIRDVILGRVKFVRNIG
ncbi:MAG TPA: phosphoribosylglycinamide formyltransferase [Bdellovibrionota bacterium]|nr:phosphoribosylglycinamide formyltransferase [Bdellovibrionota bacterium]